MEQHYNYSDMEKVKYVFYELASNEFKDFFKIDFVRQNDVHLKLRYFLNNKITGIACISNEHKQGFEKRTLTGYENIESKELAKMMIRSRCIVINIESLLAEIIGDVIKIKRIDCCFI